MILEGVQKQVMQYIDAWSRENDNPVGHSSIIKSMKEKKINKMTTADAIRSLLRKGYIRRAVSISNKTFYVQLGKI